MIITLKVKLGTYWSADIEFIDLSTLEDVHEAIQRAVEFDNDHLYAFFVARSERAHNKTVYDDENGKVYATRIRDVFPLPAKHYLYYLFDYGDNWIFRISRMRSSPHEPIDGVDYPKVVSETGQKPAQYACEDD